MKWYIINVMNTETLEIYNVYREAGSPKQAVEMVKLNEDEQIDAVFVEVDSFE